MLTLHSSTHLWTLLGILQKGVAHNELLCTLFQPVNHFIVQRCVHIQAVSRDTGLPLFEKYCLVGCLHCLHTRHCWSTEELQCMVL